MSTDRPIEKFALGGLNGEGHGFYPGGAHGSYRGTIHVGLVNNMPDPALRTTELQFARLLKEASGAIDVRLHLFSLGGIARGELALSRMEGFYADAAGLPTAGVDALIVTGAEPRASDLRAEPYWNAFARLVDWAEGGTFSTIFSCLAAHAAVLHLDNIARAPLQKKLSGVFTAERVGGDALLLGLPAFTYVPHSRRNGVPEKELTAAGYHILSRIADGGIDSFLRDDARTGRSRFLFLQGHPEYDGETLGREYLRDVGRHLRGESIDRPAIPENYFDCATEDALADLAAAGEVAERYAAVVAGARPLQSWRGHTVRLFANWLALVAAEKARRLAQAHAPAARKLRA